MTLFFFLCIVVTLLCSFFALVLYIYDKHTIEIPEADTRELKRYLDSLEQKG